MKKLKGETTIKLTVEEFNELNKLIDRNEPKAVVKQYEDYDLYYCPICGHVVLNGDNFCRECGQRVDSENIAF